LNLAADERHMQIAEYGMFILIVAAVLVWVSWALLYTPRPSERGMCRACGSPYPPIAKFCPRCGKRV